MLRFGSIKKEQLYRHNKVKTNRRTWINVHTTIRSTRKTHQSERREKRKLYKDRHKPTRSQSDTTPIHLFSNEELTRPTISQNQGESNLNVGRSPESKYVPRIRIIVFRSRGPERTHFWVQGEGRTDYWWGPCGGMSESRGGTEFNELLESKKEC